MEEVTADVNQLNGNQPLSAICCRRNGFEEEQIEALLHKIEIQMKHQSTNFGLSLASVSLSDLPTCRLHIGLLLCPEAACVRAPCMF